MIPPEMSYAAWLAEQELRRQKNVMLARNYYAGEQKVRLTPRQRQYLGHAEGGRFVDNACREVVDAVCDRLMLTGWTCGEDEEAAAYLSDLYEHARRLTVINSDVVTAAVRDGESFLLVTWDMVSGLRLIPHARFVDGQAGGNGCGIMAHYPDDDPNQAMTYAAKRWTGTVVNAQGQAEARPRLTLYYPERVEKYVRETSDESGWKPVQDPGDAGWPIPWVDRQGLPLGIPVGHFRNANLRTELWDVIPLQDALNKTLVDILAAADTSGFQLLFARGFMPTTDGRDPAADGSNLLTIAPGSIITSRAADAGLEAIPPGDLSQLLATYDRLILRIAQVSRTPAERFTRQVESADTKREGKEPLLAKVRLRQALFGEAWEAVLRVALKLGVLYGGASVTTDVPVEVLWEPTEVRDEQAELEALKLKGELGVPQEQLWREMGYSEEQIQRMQVSEEVQTRQAGRRAAAMLVDQLEAPGRRGAREQGSGGDGETGSELA